MGTTLQNRARPSTGEENQEEALALLSEEHRLWSSNSGPILVASWFGQFIFFYSSMFSSIKGTGFFRGKCMMTFIKVS